MSSLQTKLLQALGTLRQMEGGLAGLALVLMSQLTDAKTECQAIRESIMRNSPAFDLLRMYVADKKLDLDAVQNMDVHAAEAILGHIPDPEWLQDAKRCILCDMEEQARKAAMAAFMKKRFDFHRLYDEHPDTMFEEGERLNKPYITIWPEGRPAE